jgi:hypothetical protein
MIIAKIFPLKFINFSQRKEHTMRTFIASGTVAVSTKGVGGRGAHEYGVATVKFPGLTPDDQILATARPTRGGIGPIKLGPLYVPFIVRKDSTKPAPNADEFDILVYDIQGAAHAVDVPVDYVVFR